MLTHHFYTLSKPVIPVFSDIKYKFNYFLSTDKVFNVF